VNPPRAGPPDRHPATGPPDRLRRPRLL